MKLLTSFQEEIIESEDLLLSKANLLLGKLNVDKKESELLSDAQSQLHELFLLVVAGEYNSGKSAFINALLGGDFLKMGITPTTDAINILEFGIESNERIIKKGIKIISVNAPILRETRIVDTPGTNAILREHEVLTKEFIPRSDIVIFVTSIDRPFTESEREFLEHIREWGKKVVFVINKIDLVDDEKDIEKVMKFVSDNAFKLLDHYPDLFLVSAKNALKNKKENIKDTYLSKIEDYILKTLNQRERMRIKLSTPLDILDNITKKYAVIVEQSKSNIKEDRQLLTDINSQLSLFKEDSLRRFQFRYADIDNEILEFQKRGIEFFDETFRIARLFDLANNERIQREYKDKVIKNLSITIDQKVNDLIEWLVVENFSQWQTVNNKISERMSAIKSRIVSDNQYKTIQLGRKKIINDVKRESQRVIEKYDRNLEAKQIADDAQISVATSAAIEVGAIGLGTLVTILATTASADLTGILLAGLTATLGFFIIPTKKKQAKNAFNKNIESLREQLFISLSSEVSRQLDIVVDNIKATISPYDRFVKSEENNLIELGNDFDEIDLSVARLRSEIKKI